MTNTDNSSSKFEAGSRYRMTSACDSNCHWDYTVVRRSAKSLWIVGDDGETLRRSIRVWQGVERVAPLGSYSMAPQLAADRKLVELRIVR